MMLRIVAATILIIAGNLAVNWISAGYAPPEIKSPTLDLNELPTQLGEWIGENAELDPRVVGALGAHSIIDRSYQNARGERVAVHCSLWVEGPLLRHHEPTICYGNGGWGLENYDNKLKVADHLTARTMVCNRNSSRIMALWWYQAGDQVYFDSETMREAKQHFWNHTERPPLVKVLMQTEMDDPEAAKQRLIEVASKIRDWTINLKPESND